MISVSPERKGRLYRHAANTTTRGSTVAAATLSANIITEDNVQHLNKLPSFQSWGMVAALGVIAVADKFDGVLARISEKWGNPITRRHKNMDPFHDKLRYHAIAGASAFALAQSNVYLGASLAVIQSATLVRDARKTIDRMNAPEHVDTAANPFSKGKTVGLNVALLQTASPLTVHPVGQAVSLALHASGSAASWIDHYRSTELREPSTSMIPSEVQN